MTWKERCEEWIPTILVSSCFGLLGFSVGVRSLPRETPSETVSRLVEVSRTQRMALTVTMDQKGTLTFSLTEKMPCGPLTPDMLEPMVRDLQLSGPPHAWTTNELDKLKQRMLVLEQNYAGLEAGH